MAAVGVSANERSVLLVLAIMANDEAQAWPPIAGDTGLTTKCVLSERAVQRAVKRLVELGHLARRQLRNGVVYTVHPQTQLTPDCVTGVSETGDTQAPVGEAARPVTQSPKLPTTTITSPKAAPSPRTRAAGGGEFPQPEWAEDDHWRDFLANRKRKKLPNTPSAHAKLLREVERFADAEWPPGRILQHAAESGWAGIYDPRGSERRNGQRSHHNDRDRRGSLFAACADDIARGAGG